MVIIKISSKDKISSIRVSESTKRELESFGNAGESHEQILKKLMNIFRQTRDSQTEVRQSNRVTGVSYGRLNKKIDIEIDHERYSIICTYNDLTMFSMFPRHKQGFMWEIDLEIVNIGTYSDNEKWNDPKDIENKKILQLLYFIAVSQILQEQFGINTFELKSIEDYTDYEKWKQVYTRNNLSMESFERDIARKLK